MTLDEMNKSAFDRIVKIIDKFGPRLCGHKSTHDAANYIANDLSQYSEVKKEEFDVHPLAFLGFIKLMDIAFTIGILILWLNLPEISILVSLYGNIVIILEFLAYKQFVDHLFPKAKGVNVYGTIEPKEEAKHTIIFSGHHDSAHRFSYYEYTPKLTILRSAMGVILSLLLTIGDIIAIIWKLQSNVPLLSISFSYPQKVLILNIIFTLLIPLAFTSWNFALKDGTPGAGDNLISVSIGIELAKHYSEHKLKNTRLIIASFDGEECGLRGAHEFFQKHKDELIEQKAIQFNVDSPFFLNEFVLLTSDINGFVPLDDGLATQIKTVADRIGIKCQKKPLPMLLGGTDAAEGARIGLRSTTLIGLPWTVGDRVPVYHTHLDTPDAVEPGAVDGVIRIAMNFIDEIDSKSE